MCEPFLCTEFVLMFSITRASIYWGGISDEWVNRVYNKFGPTPRVCIDYLFKPVEMKEYEDNVQRAVSDITSQSSKNCLTNLVLLEWMTCVKVGSFTSNLAHTLSKSDQNIYGIQMCKLFYILINERFMWHHQGWCQTRTKDGWYSGGRIAICYIPSF